MYYFRVSDSSIVLLLARFDIDNNGNRWSYQMSKFRINYANNKLDKVTEWTVIIHSFEESGSYFFVKNQLFFIVGTEELELKMQVFDIEEEQFKGIPIIFQNHQEGKTFKGMFFCV
jgi:hypothetical protein